jgi:Flp pilus assembly protein TadG
MTQFSRSREIARRRLSGATIRGDPSSSGQAMVEFAMTIAIFALLLFGLIGMAIVFFAWLTTSSAARDGARFLVGDYTASGDLLGGPTATDQDVITHICTTSVMLGGSPTACQDLVDAGELEIMVEPSNSDGDSDRLQGSSVSVTVRFRVPVPTMRVPFLGTSGITFLGPIWVQSASRMWID